MIFWSICFPGQTGDIQGLTTGPAEGPVWWKEGERSAEAIGDLPDGFGGGNDLVQFWSELLDPRYALRSCDARNGREGGGARGQMPEFRDIVGVPKSWLTGVARLNDQHHPRDVPAHRWRQFIVDSYRFLLSSEGCAYHAADLGWDALSLFGCDRSSPLIHLDRAGLWVVGGGRIVRLRGDWAEIQPPGNTSGRTYHRRRVDPSVVMVPWRR